jgi:hypothetical protein
MNERPNRPKQNQPFQRGYGYEIPRRFIRWEWSVSFNRWGAVVEFDDDMPIYTWPQDETPAGNQIRIEHTPAGAQTVISETPARQVPKAPLRAKRPQNDSPLALELPAIEAQQFKLF